MDHLQAQFGVINAATDDMRKVVQQLMENGHEKSSETKEAFDYIMQVLKKSISDIESVEGDLKELQFVMREVGTASNKVSDSAEYLNEVMEMM